MAARAHPQANPDPWKADKWPSRLPVGDAREGGDSAWELWQEASRRLDLAFAPTEPSCIAAMSTASDIGETVETETRHHLLNAHNVMVVARRNNRVCPNPAHWTELYHQIAGERHTELEPPPVQPWLWPRLSGLQ